MIKQDTLKRIASILKIDEAELNSAITATEEKDLVIPDGLVALTTDELSARDTAQVKKGYDKGAEASIEMLVKDKKRELGLEFEGKEPAKLFESFQAKVLSDAKLAPNTALVEKDNIINGLRTNLSALEAAKVALEGSVAKVKVEAAVMRAIPSNLIAGVEPEEVLLTMRNKGYDFEEKDGAIVAKKAGEVVADTALRPIAVGDVIKNYVTERGWIGEGGDGSGSKSGRGGSHSKPNTGVPTKLSEAEKQWKDSGKNAGTAEFQAHIDGLVKENPNFVLD